MEFILSLSDVLLQGFAFQKALKGLFSRWKPERYGFGVTLVYLFFIVLTKT